MLSFEGVEEVCGSKSITLVVHPAIRRAVKGYEESFYIGLRCFLKGETDGVYFFPFRWWLCPATVFRSVIHLEGTRSES